MNSQTNNVVKFREPNKLIADVVPKSLSIYVNKILFIKNIASAIEWQAIPISEDDNEST